GVPMLCAGDEVARTQQGNNNAYCQDDPTSWMDWRPDRRRRDLLAFARALVATRRQHPVLRRRHFFQGRPIRGSEVKDLAWFRPDGHEATDDDWTNPHTRCLGLRLSGDAMDEVDAAGHPVSDDTVLVLLNAHHDGIPFVLPAHRRGLRWEPLLDTAAEAARRRRTLRGGDVYDLEGRSLAVLLLRRRRDSRGGRRASTGPRGASRTSGAGTPAAASPGRM